MSSPAPRCPLCKTGHLTAATREVAWKQTRVSTEAWLCSACREVVLDAGQVGRLRDAVRREGLAVSDREVDEVLERLLLQAE